MVCVSLGEVRVRVGLWRSSQPSGGGSMCHGNRFLPASTALLDRGLGCIAHKLRCVSDHAAVQLHSAVDHKDRGIAKMFGAHDSRLVSAWHLRSKGAQLQLGLSGIHECALGIYIALWAKAPSQPQRHRHADTSLDPADDHGIGGLLPAQVIPVVSVVGLEQLLAELHRWPRRATGLLAGRESCEVDAPAAHAEVAG
eukprot:scaffold100894_cov57-Phaeocystis_antarctica.AAC.2